jgi:flagellin
MGSFSILNNISGISAQNQLNLNNVNLSRTLVRLSSGKRINTGADDAAGLQVADSLRANVRALDQAVRNANDGVSVGQIADGALSQMSELLTRAVTLAGEAATETTDSTNRTALDAEFTAIKDEIQRIAAQTNFNGTTLFTTAGFNGSLKVFVGDMSGASSIAVTIATIDSTHVGNVDISAASLTTQDGAAAALTTIKNALNGVSSQRADIGAGINRLQSAVAVLQTTSQNTQAAESAVRDANVAQEVSRLVSYQILAQSGVAALAQANTNSQVVLNLMRNI